MLKRYNKYNKNYTEIKEGEKFCKSCRGAGMVKSKRDYTFKKTDLLVCSKCLGTGKLDWVEKVVGKKPFMPIIDLKIERTQLVAQGRRLTENWTIK